MKFFFIILTTFGVFFIKVLSQEGAINLKRDLFSNYDSQSRPVENTSQIMNICVGLYVLQIVGLSERSQVMQANIQLVFIWNDSFLKWNASEYDNVRQLFVKSSMIWTPDIIIMDSADERAHRGHRDNYLLIVNSNGKVRWHYQTLSRSFCEIDIMNFPFDEQTCSINIRSSSRDKNMLHIIKRNLKVKVMETIKTEWFIVNSSVEETSLIISRNTDLTEFTVVKFTIKLRRVTTYYFAEILVPFTIIASISLFTFWLSPDSGEKLTLDITILLSLVFYLQIISEYIPRGFSKIPVLTLYTLTNFTVVFLSCIMTVFVLKLYYKPPSFLPASCHQLPYVVRLVLFKYLAPIMLMKFHFRDKHETYISTLIKTINDDIESFKTKKINKTDEILDTLELLNKSFRLNITSNDLLLDLDNEKYSNEKTFYNNLNTNEKNFYYEEWKQAALVLDRLLFFTFLICMPMTSLVFLRANIVEYMSSTGENKSIPNINC